ncbi:MAG: histidine triad nucleotide-binding protein [Simkaniaceae bacterium]|nr:histidine triad nucleotide-binding protein [Simkaniaceae bacterium]
MSTIFGKIIRNELPAQKVYEDDLALAIKDIAPQAPVHILIMPKKEYRSLQSVPEKELSIIGHLVNIAQKLAKEYKIEDNYRFLTNNGELAGQSVGHMHFHLIGGDRLGPIG